MAPREHVISLLKFTRTISEGILKDIPEHKLTYQASPFDNHPLWVMSHLAGTDAWIAGVSGIPGVEVSERISKATGMGSKPVDDPAQYAPAAEVRRAFDSSRAAILRWLETASDAALNADIRDKTGGFATTVLDALYKLAWHEGWHMGQAATVRKALGLPPVMG